MDRPDRIPAAALMRSAILRNPFYVLELRPGCGRAEVERQGQKLLGMLELGLSAALLYQTPAGTAERTADGVRQAMAELRDPERRLLHELWAHLEVPAVAGRGEAGPGEAGPGRAGRGEAGPGRAGGEAGAGAVDRLAPWAGALQALGFAAPGGTR